MSFDLHLCRATGDSAGAAEVDAAMSEIPRCRRADGDPPSWLYFNPATRAYCQFDLEPSASEEAIAEACSLEPYRGAFLTASVNYLRPSFFADELMPVVARLCERLDALVVDPQAEDSDEPQPAPVDEAGLAASWRRSNARAVAAARGQGTKLRVWTRDRADSWWRYQCCKDALQDRIEHAFVPTLGLFTHGDDGAVKSVVVWTDFMPIVAPSCDVYCILRHKRGLLSAKVKDVFEWTEAETVRRLVGGRARSIESEAGPLEIFDEAAAAHLAANVKSLALRPDWNRFKHVDEFLFVDVED